MASILNFLRKDAEPSQLDKLHKRILEDADAVRVLLEEVEKTIIPAKTNVVVPRTFADLEADLVCKSCPLMKAHLKER